MATRIREKYQSQEGLKMDAKTKERYREWKRRRVRRRVIIPGILLLLLLGIGGLALFLMDGGIQFEPVTIDGFEVTTTFEQVFDQGEYDLDAGELAALLPGLTRNVQAHQNVEAHQNFTFYLELVDMQLMHEFEADELAKILTPLPEMISITIDTEGTATFEEITFYHAGTFTYRIYQSAMLVASELDESEAEYPYSWNLDESYFHMMVTVTEDEAYEVLRASIEYQETPIFTNELIIYIEDQITPALALLRAQQFLEMHDDLEIVLQEMVETRGGTRIGISYLCLTTGRQISINGDRLFNAASTSKLPTHMMVADAVHSGRITWDSHVAFSSAHREGGTGILQNSIRIGDTVPASRLIELSITHSDNIAHHMLAGGFVGRGQDRRNAFFSRYLSGQTVPTTNSLTADHLMTLLRILYEGRYEVEGYRIIIEHMSNTIWTDRLYTETTADYVSHIIGTFNGFTHDAGIFHLEHPYILVVMTSGVGARFISEVSDAVFEFHHAFQ